MKQTYTLGAFAIILDEKDRVLLCHRRDYDLWNLPGGGVEANESPWECVVREVKEETGLDVQVESLAGVYSKQNSTDVVFSFICKVIGGKITPTDEADILKYFAFHEIPANTSANQVERIKDILVEKQKMPVMKMQANISSIYLIKQGKL